jgi:hypothetical protein
MAMDASLRNEVQSNFEATKCAAAAARFGAGAAVAAAGW